MVQYWLQPMVVLMLWITYNSSSILQNFQIADRNCILYMLSSIILAISYQINMFFIFHVCELYFNFDYKNIVEELLARFNEKDTFWITDSECWPLHLEGMDTKMKACNRYCLSSQMFFIVSLYTFLIYMFIIGFSTIIAAQYNILGDYFLPLITLFWVALLNLLRHLLRSIVHFFDIWDYASFASGGNRITEEQEVPSADP
jgi:hypothetical protein